MDRAAYSGDLKLQLAVLSTVAAGVYLLYAIVSAIWSAKSRKLPPGPIFSIPLIGDGALIATSSNPLSFFFKRFARYGPVFPVKMFGVRIWVVTDMAALRAPLRDEGAEMEIPWPSFMKLMGFDEVPFITAMPDVHGAWRKLFAQALTPPQMAAMVPRILDVMNKHLAEWEREGKLSAYAAGRAMGIDLAVDAICTVPLNSVDRDWFKKQVTTFMDGLYGLPYALPGTGLSRGLVAKEALLGALATDMRPAFEAFKGKWDAAGGTMAEFAARNQGPSEAAAGAEPAGGAAKPGPQPLGVLDAEFMSFAALGKWSPRNAGLAVLHALVATGDTTRVSLFNTWALVARSERVQHKLFEEQQQVMAQHGPELSYAAACAMPYMDATVREAMRLLPASSGGLRRLTADLAIGPYVVPKGEFVWYHAGLLHAIDPALWDGAKGAAAQGAGGVPAHMDWQGGLEGAFRPERWLGGEGAEGRPRHHVTFGAGSHLCLGMNLVYLELKLMLALVLRKYSLRLATPDMLNRCTRRFPFFTPAPGTDTVLLQPREA